MSELTPSGLQGGLESLLQPVSAAAPCGVPVRYEAEYDLLREARREDDTSLPTGIWQAEIKRGDWVTVEKVARQVLQNRSKDLTVAVWLGEAWIHRRQLEGLSSALHLLLALCERYWEGLYPLPQDGDISFRAGPLDLAVHSFSTLLLSRMPMPVLDLRSETGPFTLADWRALQRSLALDQGKSTHKSAQAQVDAAKKMQQKTEEMIRNADAKSIRIACGFVADALETMLALEQFCNLKMEHEAPGFQSLRLLLQEFESLLKDWLAMHPQPVVPPVEEVALPQAEVRTEARAELPLTHPVSREDAYRQLRIIADYLAKTEPHSPVPYLIYRSVEWGNKPLRDLLGELISSDAEARRLWTLLGVLP